MPRTTCTLSEAPAAGGQIAQGICRSKWQNLGAALQPSRKPVGPDFENVEGFRPNNAGFSRLDSSVDQRDGRGERQSGHPANDVQEQSHGAQTLPKSLCRSHREHWHFRGHLGFARKPATT